MTTKKTMTLTDFLTDVQITKAAKLWTAHGTDAVDKIEAQVIAPNMAAINAKLGQENDSRFLAYAVVYAFSQGEERRWS